MIKIFLEFDRIDFRGAPTTHYELTYKWTASISAETIAETPITEVGTCIASYEIFSQPTTVYQTVYDAMLAICAERGWPQPTKQDVFAFVPMDFQTLIGQ